MAFHERLEVPAWTNRKLVTSAAAMDGLSNVHEGERRDFRAITRATCGERSGSSAWIGMRERVGE